MNAPDRFESFILPDGAKKLEAVKTISGVKNSMIFRIEREDHTLGNMIRTELHKNPKVIFSGYKIPHPLQHHLEIYIQTQDGYKPATALNEALSTLISDIAKMRSNFDMGLADVRRRKREYKDKDSELESKIGKEKQDRAIQQRQLLRESRGFNMNPDTNIFDEKYSFSNGKDISPIRGEASYNNQTSGPFGGVGGQSDGMGGNYQVGFNEGNEGDASTRQEQPYGSNYDSLTGHIPPLGGTYSSSAGIAQHYGENNPGDEAASDEEDSYPTESYQIQEPSQHQENYEPDDF